MTCRPAPSPTIVRWLQAAGAGRTALDVAAGGGRHTQLLLACGYRVTAVDRDTTALADLASDRCEVLTADLEAEPWPLPGRTFDLVLVTNYLWRPRFAALLAAVAPGGELLYETFAVGHEQFGRPRNPEFLLQEGELPARLPGAWQVVEYAHGPEGDPQTAVRQRIRARRPHHEL